MVLISELSIIDSVWGTGTHQKCSHEFTTPSSLLWPIASLGVVLAIADNLEASYWKFDDYAPFASCILKLIFFL